MNRTARSVLRKLGTDQHLDDERGERLRREMEEAHHRQAAHQEGTSGPGAPGLEDVPDELLSESEKRHEKYRRQQAMAGRFTPAAERLPIMTAAQREERDKDRPKWTQTQFEGPVGKLIEKYGDLQEVQKHLTLGQSMKYEFTPDGKVLDRDGNVIFDGEKVLRNA
jgi:hypothetical protein